MSNWVRWIVSFLCVMAIAAIMLGIALLLQNYFIYCATFGLLGLICWVLVAKFKWEIIDSWCEEKNHEEIEKSS